PVSFREVVKAVMPAVVSIEAKTTVKERRRGRAQKPAEEEPIPDNFRKFFDDLEKRQIEPSMADQKTSFGSGFLVDPQGVVLTNYHVVAGVGKADVSLSDGRKFSSKEIKGDEKTDLAIIRLDVKSAKLPYLE